MFFKNIYEKGLAQASYMIGCQKTGEAIVVDPQRDIAEYLEIAKQEKLKITHVTETHIHADFLSGARELASATGAELLLSDEGGADWEYQFEHKGLRDGDSFMVGNIRFDVMHTPGHTPEHISFLVTDTPASDKPIIILTGDFVFVGDVGRPDLLEKAAGVAGTMEAGARQMFQSLKRFRELPDYIQLWPGHGAGSACGKALGAVPASTVGYEKIVNWALKIDNEEEFVKAILEGQPEPPKYFAMMKKLNKEGAPILGEIPQPGKLSKAEVFKALDEGATIVDSRNKVQFAEGHIPGSFNIQDNGSFSTWSGWLLDYKKPFILVAADDRIQHLTKSLIRIGLDNIAGYIPNVNDFKNDLVPLHNISAEDAFKKIESGESHVLDVRATSEYNDFHIDGAQHIHGGYLPERFDEVPKDKHVIVHCIGGDRSSTATSVLMSKGFKNVTNMLGGINAWKKANLPVVKESAKEEVAA
jgi:hydroxyacylglutathione hydrolase